MEILKLYTDKNYDNCIKRIEKAKLLPDNINDLNDFITNQATGKLRVWIKVTDFTIADNINYRSESNLLITLLIRLFARELDVDEVNLSNKEIIKDNDLFVAFVTPNYVNSEDCMSQLRYAIRLGKPVRLLMDNRVKLHEGFFRGCTDFKIVRADLSDNSTDELDKKMQELIGDDVGDNGTEVTTCAGGKDEMPKL